MDQTFKGLARDRAIKRLVCSTVWHSAFNGFMAVQTQLGRFQNSAPICFSLSVGLRYRTKGKRKWSVLLESPDGYAQDSWSSRSTLCLYMAWETVSISFSRSLLFYIANEKEQLSKNHYFDDLFSLYTKLLILLDRCTIWSGAFCPRYLIFHRTFSPFSFHFFVSQG